MPRPPCPERVWVAAMIVTAEIAVKDRAATGQLTGGLGGLFAPTVIKPVTNARICGVATTQAEARNVLDDWQAANPGIQGEEVLEQVAFGLVAQEPVTKITHACLTCGTLISQGHWCMSCADMRNASMRDEECALALAEGRKL
jgi:hypothetical protein